MKTPVLETRRLILKPLYETDAKSAFLWTGDADVSRFMRYARHKELEVTRAWLKQEESLQDTDTCYDFGFRLKETDELIGSGGLVFNQEQGVWELGYNLRRDCWNQGYATEAAAAVLDFAEHTLHIHRVIACHAKENPASGRVLEKNGFTYVKDSSYKKWDGSQSFESREYIWKSQDQEKDPAARNEVERYYDEEYEEWERLAWHKPEFEVTKRYLREFIPEGCQKILDIGGGPGRYAIYLTQQGHEVTLLDLSGKNIRQALEKAAEAGVKLDSCIHGDALRLSEYLYKEEQFDVVLLMGPLYHLLHREDREKALGEAVRVLKPGGRIFASFISDYAPIQDFASGLYDFGAAERLLSYLEDGRNQEEYGGFTTAYFTSETEAKELMAQAGLEELVFAGVENILCGKENILHGLSEELQEKWMDLAFRLSRDENLLGMNEHFLYIGRKPVAKTEK